jgi:hypothetical protein
LSITSFSPNDSGSSNLRLDILPRAVDVSGSMRQPVIGASSIEARDASAAMMLLTAKTEKEFEVVAFSEGLKELNVNKEDTLETELFASRCHKTESCVEGLL